MTNSPGGGHTRIRLGDLLVKAGVISQSQLNTALHEQKQWGGKLGDILVRMRYLTEDIFVRALSKQLRLERADLTRPIPLDALAKVPAALAEEYEVVPVALTDGGRVLQVATSDPLNITVLDAIRSVTQLRVVAQVAGASQVRAAITRLYRTDDLPPTNEAMEVTGNSLPAEPTHTPVFGVPVSQIAQGYRPPESLAGAPTPAFGMPAMPHLTQERPASAEETQRQVAALKALVELLVQKGVISLDEYLARLRRT